MTVRTQHSDLRSISIDRGLSLVWVTETDYICPPLLRIECLVTAEILLDLLPALTHYAEHGRLPEPSEGTV